MHKQSYVPIESGENKFFCNMNIEAHSGLLYEPDGRFFLVANEADDIFFFKS